MSDLITTIDLPLATTEPIWLQRARASGFREGYDEQLEERPYRKIEALSYSGVKKLVRSAMHYMHERTHPSDPTASMQLGTVVHWLIQEPHVVADATLLMPEDAPKRPTSVQRNAKKPSPETLDAIAWWDDFEARAAGRVVLKAEDWQKAQDMAGAVLEHPSAAYLYETGTGRPEVSMQWIDGRWQIPMKARIDWSRWHTDRGFVDLKTAVDASPEGFARACASLLYHVQVATYFSGAEHLLDESPKYWMWVVVENEAPYGVAVYNATADAIHAGQRLMELGMRRYRESVEANQWRGYPDTIQPLQLPGWALKFNPLNAQ